MSDFGDALNSGYEDPRDDPNYNPKAAAQKIIDAEAKKPKTPGTAPTKCPNCGADQTIYNPNMDYSGMNK